MDNQARIEALEQQVHAMRRRLAVLDHWHDTLHSPWYMRLWWWMQGYRLLSLGTWYRAPWNRGARKYE